MSDARSGPSASGAPGRSRAIRAGSPDVGRAVPAWSIAALGLVAAVVGSVVVVGASGWLVVALVLAVGAAVLPRVPFGALLVVQLAVAAVFGGGGADRGEVAVLLLTTHLVLVTGMTWAWTPVTARVQLRALRRPAVRFVLLQLGVQAAGLVITAVDGSGAGTARPGDVWFGVIGVVVLLALAVGVAIPTLARARTH